MPSSLRALPRGRLSDAAYVAIRDAIVAGELAPGAVLRDVELAGSLGLSRTPVREALQRLADEGLVESKPHAYTRVTPLVRAVAVEAHLVVRALHELAVELAVPRLRPADLQRLHAANEAFALALAAADVEGALAADDAFHGVFVDVAGNRLVHDTLARTTPLVRRLERLRFGSPPGRESVAAHDAIAEAAARGDVAAAVRATRANWDRLGELIERAFDVDVAGTVPPPAPPTRSEAP